MSCHPPFPVNVQRPNTRERASNDNSSDVSSSYVHVGAYHTYDTFGVA